MSGQEIQSKITFKYTAQIVLDGCSREVRHQKREILRRGTSSVGDKETYKYLKRDPYWSHDAYTSLNTLDDYVVTRSPDPLIEPCLNPKQPTL